MIKVAFINPSKAIYPPLGLAYLVSYTKQYLDLEAKVFDLEIKPGQLYTRSSNLIKQITSFAPDIIAFTGTSNWFNDIKQLASFLKSKLDIPLIFGGPHITSYVQNLPEIFDMAVTGEAEKSFKEILEIFQREKSFKSEFLKDIKGIAYWDGNKLIVNPPQDFIANIDDIPHPDRTIFDWGWYLQPNEILTDGQMLRGTTLLTSRGCPYKCSFCQVTEVWGKPRYHSAERVIQEIQSLYDAYRVEAINIIDDLFVANLPRLKKIVDYLEKSGLNKKIKFAVNGRANLINKTLLELLKRMNVEIVALGLESMEDKILRSLKNGVTAEQNKSAVDLLYKEGFKISGLFMIGTPAESQEDILVTLNYIKEKESVWGHVHLCITTPLPGTKLWDEALKTGKIKVTDDLWSRLDPQLDDLNLKDKTYIGDIPTEQFLETAKVFIKTKDEINNKNAPLDSIWKRFTFNNLKRAIKDPQKLFKFTQKSLSRIKSNLNK